MSTPFDRRTTRRLERQLQEAIAGVLVTAGAQATVATERRMFGGIGFLLNGNMCVGIWKASLIVRHGPEEAAVALQEPKVVEFDITGRPMVIGLMNGWRLGAWDRQESVASRKPNESEVL
jgi:hypothetical protein